MNLIVKNILKDFFWIKDKYKNMICSVYIFFKCLDSIFQSFIAYFVSPKPWAKGELDVEMLRHISYWHIGH